MTITACIFDLDGVIVDTAKYHFKAWQKIAESFDFQFTHAQNETLKGISRYDSLTKLLEYAGVTQTEDQKIALCADKNEIYLDLVKYMDHSEILPGVKEFLEELREKGIKIALGSASKNAIPILEKIGLKEYFEIIIDGNSVSNSKPHPEVFLSGAEGLGVTPSETVVFEDSQKGLEAAIAGKFITIGIGSPEHLSEADAVVPGFEQMTFKSLKDLLAD